MLTDKGIGTITGFELGDDQVDVYVSLGEEETNQENFEWFKPILRRMDSLKDDEEEVLQRLKSDTGYRLVHWCVMNRIDVFGLIKLGLAVDYDEVFRDGK